MSQPRITPLQAPFSEPVQAAFAKIMPEGVPPLALFRTLAINERVFLRMMAGMLLDRGSISLRDREIMIDIGWRKRQCIMSSRWACQNARMYCGVFSMFSTRTRALSARRRARLL